MNRSGWTPLLLGLVVGLAAGLIYGWVLQPARPTQAAPTSLRSDFQDEYAALIASAFAATGDLPRARARLGLLPGASDSDHLNALAQAWLATGRSESEARALAALAAGLVERTATPSAVAAPTRPPATNPPATAAVTTRPRATPLPTLTPGAPFRLSERDLVCDDPAPEPRIQVIVLDAAGEGVPDILVQVIWDAGQDQFYTGLKPDMGVGFGDFTLAPDTVYTVQLADSDAIATGLQAETCTSPSGETHWGSWRLTFVQPEAP
ncbi:MAG TPA: hypothetical protein VK449_08170 [Anaerolineales bacterium]|nr:hypothetical protein [Anaerolineales bacterium]